MARRALVADHAARRADRLVAAHAVPRRRAAPTRRVAPRPCLGVAADAETLDVAGTTPLPVDLDPQAVSTFAEELGVILRSFDAVAAVAVTARVTELTALGVSPGSREARSVAVRAHPAGVPVIRRRALAPELAMAGLAVARDLERAMALAACVSGAGRSVRSRAGGLTDLVVARAARHAGGLVATVRESQVADFASRDDELARHPARDLGLVLERVAELARAVTSLADAPRRHAGAVAARVLPVTSLAANPGGRVRVVAERRSTRTRTEHTTTEEHRDERRGGDDHAHGAWKPALDGSSSAAFQNHIRSPAITVWYSSFESRS